MAGGDDDDRSATRPEAPAVIPKWESLSQSERNRLQTAKSFLKTRLSERATVDWALRLKPAQRAERYAIMELLDGHPAPTVEEPYATAWRLIQESWSSRGSEQTHTLEVHDIRRRVRVGDCSRVLVENIADLVAPRLEVKALEDRPWLPVKRPHTPKDFHDLLLASLTSITLHSVFGNGRGDMGFDEISDIPFLISLASTLIARVDHGLYIAHRIYGDKENWAPSGNPARVYFDYQEEGEQDEHGPRRGDRDPDAFSRGLAPSVKVLHLVVARIAELDERSAQAHLWHWRHSASDVYRRLWAALARDARLVAAKDVGKFLLTLDDVEFWNPVLFPEFTELRALRFSDLDEEARHSVLGRLKKGPPRNLWARKVKPKEVKTYQESFVAREFRRIEIAGGVLPREVQEWLHVATAAFPNLVNMTIDEGFRGRLARAGRPPVSAAPGRYDEVEGEQRLRLLDQDLRSGRRSRHEDRAEQADAWVREPEHAVLVLGDLEAVSGGIHASSQVWDCFGWHHRPPQTQDEEIRDAQAETERVLRLLEELSEGTLVAAIEGISNWLATWKGYVVRSELGGTVWQRIWPISVEATNNVEVTAEEKEFDAFFETDAKKQAPADVNTLASPAGRLVGVLISALLSSDNGKIRFADGEMLTQMRNQVMSASGLSRLIARCLFMEELPTLLQTDPEWTKQNLVDVLSANNAEAILLWRAVAFQIVDTDALNIVGEEACKILVDDRLGEPAREILVVSLIVEGLSALRDEREMAVSDGKVSQMLRQADDDIRRHAAHTIRMFQEDESNSPRHGRSAEDIFLSSVKPFLEMVWPQERSLGSKGVSGEFSVLPSLCGDAFADTVEAIDRFLVPFDCWSMFDYGFDESDSPEHAATTELSNVINDEVKAKALLHLLDLTIGEAENATVPHDLSAALGQIEVQASRLRRDPAFRRLSTAARR